MKKALTFALILAVVAVVVVVGAHLSPMPYMAEPKPGG